MCYNILIKCYLGGVKMFYKVELDYVDINDDMENPKFYLKENELISFVNICSRSNHEVKVFRISEDEYNNHITIE